MSDILSDGGRADAINRLNGPGIGLIVVGAINLLSSLFGIASGLFGMALGNRNDGMPDFSQIGGLDAQQQEMIQEITNATSGALGVFTSFVQLLVAMVLIFGGVKMRTAEMYSLCVAAAVLSIIPCMTSCCCCCVSMPVGIWALVVLLDQNVKAAFR